VYLSKREREIIRDKFKGRCAYCGCVLGLKWHVDHIDPVIRDKGTALHPNRHNIDNLWPSCPPCNIDKSRMSIDAWREWLVLHVTNLRRKASYRNAVRFGLIAETEKPVQFYFEKKTPKD